MRKTRLYDWVRWAIGKDVRYVVAGDSMSPALCDGDWVFATPADSHRAEVPVGDVVVVKHPFIREKLLIKRVKDVSEDGFFIVGDNPASSTDSRTLGCIPWSHLVAKVNSVWPAKH